MAGGSKSRRPHFLTLSTNPSEVPPSDKIHNCPHPHLSQGRYVSLHKLASNCLTDQFGSCSETLRTGRQAEPACSSFHLPLNHTVVVGASLGAQLVNNLPAMQVTPVRFLGWEEPLEKG